MTATQRRFSWMTPLPHAAASEEREMDDGFLDTECGTIAPAEAEAVIAAKTRGGVHGFVRLGGLLEKTGGSLQIERLAGLSLFAN